MPADGSNSANFWMDLQVDTSPPTGTSYRLWPNYPTLPGAAAADTTGYTLATEFQLSQSCTLDNLWFYSAPGATALPTRCAIWNVSSQAVVSGTNNSSPSWSGAAGSGWVSCAYSGVTLPAGDYKTAVFNGGGSRWYQVTVNYWGTGGPGASGITAGPVTAPGCPLPRAPARAPTTRAPGPIRRATGAAATARTSGLMSRSLRPEPARARPAAGARCPAERGDELRRFSERTAPGASFEGSPGRPCCRRSCRSSGA